MPTEKRKERTMLRIMTHNVWNRDDNNPEWAEKGNDCSAAVRVKGHMRVYEETQPDIIGGQEFSRLMAELMKGEFEAAGKNYALIWGRFTPILYRPEKLELLNTEFLTYPEELPGYEGEFNDVKSKACNIAVFRVKESGNVFVFATTHLWWKAEPGDPSYANVKGNELLGSDKAREYQISLAIEKIEKYRKTYGNCPAVFVGDMNTGYDTEAIKYAVENGYRHARFIATDFAETAVGYHNCFGWGYEPFYLDLPFETAIDHILVKGEKEGSVKRFERYSPEYYLPISDHSPAFIDFDI